MRIRAWVTMTAAVLLAAAGLCAMLVARVASMEADARLTFVIDPGHGGEDGGAVSADGLRESDVNLDVCLKLDALLGLFGADAVLTRESDSIQYPAAADTVRKRKRADQEQRVKLVAATPYAVLVSVHQNKYTGAGPSGLQVFYNDVPVSRDFALYAQARLPARADGTRREAAEISDGIYLMRQADCPAILVECGFLSNPGDLALLKTDAYRTELALGLALSCVGYTKELENHYGKG